jgi:hypothetical protein
MLRRFIALLLLISVCGPASQTSAAVVINYANTYAQVYNGPTSNSNNQSNTGGAIAVATLPGYSSTTISLINSASMSASFVQSRPGSLYAVTDGRVNSGFTTDVNVPYTAGGSFSNPAGYTLLFAQLFDISTNSFLFYSDQESSSGPAVFTLGGTAGNSADYFQGSLTGTLLAGHLYEWYGEASSRTNPTDDGATATGGISLTIGAVPEVSSAIVWSLLALTIGGAGWWTRLKMAA